jgi:formate hydrogenlyase subunit 3/multisubunit Na+/H+ antiporter MnhD subunit
VRTGALLAIVVASHWVLDALAHRPDMPLTVSAESARVGLGLWNSVAGTIAVELLLFAAGLWLYTSTTRAIDRTGRLALRGLVAFLVVIYAANLFGPPPPSGMAAAWSALAMWLLVAWGYWVDRHREVVRR